MAAQAVDTNFHTDELVCRYYWQLANLESSEGVVLRRT